MKAPSILILVLALAAGRLTTPAENVSIDLLADHVTHTNSHYLTGACIEDVNHEVYGGIDSQMIYGESFAEPAPPVPLNGFHTYGGNWMPNHDSIVAEGGTGAKIILDQPPFSEGQASVDLWFADQNAGNGGLIVKVAQAGDGADKFDGYEISLDPTGRLILGRHRQNWESLRNLPCSVPLNQWVNLTVRMTGKSLEVLVNGQSLLQYEDTEHPLESGTIGLRTWQRNVQFRNLSVTTGGQTRAFTFEPDKAVSASVSGAWHSLREGSINGHFALDQKDPFSGRQSQQLIFTIGTGSIGIANEGLNSQGLNVVKGKPDEGYLYARADQPTEIVVSLENRTSAKVYAEAPLKIAGTQWQRLDFKLKPNTSDPAGRFAIKLKQPGTVNIGYAFLQPGKWGRYENLPVRKDVGQGLVNQGVTVLRQGGCMANAAEYRWKKMIGPRAQRPPYAGYWHPASSNGWGIFDFLNYCEAAGILGIPDVNINETPQDMADFIDYANGPSDSVWGRQRASDGHPAPYHLKYLEIGNEERVDETYWQKFEPIAKAIWAHDPDIILVVGDFGYGDPITDPFHITGNPDRLTTLAAHQKILQLAKANQREVWFDVHVNTEGPRPDFGATFSYIDALDRLADGAKHRVVIFELNADNHSQRRALANAAAINQIERDGRLPICTSANCLQVDGQNDNDWNQGLLFLNPTHAWLQPPGYVTRMISENFQPRQIATEVHDPANQLDVSAQCSTDGKTLVVQAVNFTDHSIPTTLNLQGFVPAHASARIEQLAAPLDAANTSTAPDQVKTSVVNWPHHFADGKILYTFPPYSFTVLQLK
jgi:hypothetical protein